MHYKYTFPDGKVYIGQTRRNPAIRHREFISPVTGPTNGRFWEAYLTFHICKYEIVCRIFNGIVAEIIQLRKSRLPESMIEVSYNYEPIFVREYVVLLIGHS